MLIGQNLITFTLITKEEYNLHIRKEKKILEEVLDSQSRSRRLRIKVPCIFEHPIVTKNFRGLALDWIYLDRMVD